VHRREVFNYLKKNMGEYFDSKDPAKDIDPLIKMCEEISE
jgi:hypothetical protein